MQYYRSDPQCPDAMWRAECASVADYCVGDGIDPGAGSRTLDAAMRCYDIAPQEPHIEKADATALPVADNSVDFVFNSHLIEHLPSARAAIVEWLRVVKPGGHVAMVIPDCRYTNCANTDATPHVTEYSPREFVQNVLGCVLGIDEPYFLAMGRMMDWVSASIASLSPACERWSFACVLRKVG